jgi:hypothetical protein
LINATSLNSGHLWHFTASWMGEPPGPIDPVDVNRRYRRLYYHQAPTAALRDYRLGHAVAASACVPGLFDPLVIEHLYPERTVRLVDGGVNDNQGTSALLNEGCSFVFCSDASGQMEDVPRPPGGLLGPLARSSQAIFMDRIREAQYLDLQGRVDASALSGLFFIHLKQQLPSPTIDWIGCTDAPTAAECRRTEYGIDVDIQRQIAEIRTDLDSFTEVEAYALMLSGYLMTEWETKRLQAEHARTGAQTQWGDFDIDAPRAEWPFLGQLEAIAAKPAGDPDPRRQDLGRQLATSSSLFFKAWQLCPDVRRSVRTIALAIAFVWLAVHGFSLAAVARQALLLAGGLLSIGGAAAAVAAWNWLFPARPRHNYVGKAAGMLAGWIIAQLHLRFFDARYLERGRLDRLLSLGAAPPGTPPADPPA